MGFIMPFDSTFTFSGYGFWNIQSHGILGESYQLQKACAKEEPTQAKNVLCDKQGIKDTKISVLFKSPSQKSPKENLNKSKFKSFREVMLSVFFPFVLFALLYRITP